MTTLVASPRDRLLSESEFASEASYAMRKLIADELRKRPVTNVSELSQLVDDVLDSNGFMVEDHVRGYVGLRIARSVSVSPSTVEALLERLEGEESLQLPELFDTACDYAFADAKEQELDHLVPFGVQVSDKVVDPTNPTGPMNFSFTFTRTTIILPDDGPTNDDY